MLIWATVKTRSIRPTFFSYFKDLNIAENFALLLHTHPHMQEDPSQHLRTTSRPNGLPEEDGSPDAECDKSITWNNEQLQSTNYRSVHLPWENSLICRQGRQIHQESPLQGQKCFQNAEQHLKVIPAQHQDYAKTVQKLCRFHPYLWLRVLEDDKSDFVKLSTFHT